MHVFVEVYLFLLQIYLPLLQVQALPVKVGIPLGKPYVAFQELRSPRFLHRAFGTAQGVIIYAYKPYTCLLPVSIHAPE
jgi:hypothetical protein